MTQFLTLGGLLNWEKLLTPFSTEIRRFDRGMGSYVGYGFYYVWIIRVARIQLTKPWSD